MSATGKIALVTGGSRGLGRDMALNLAKKGIDVIITYNSNKDSAEEVVKDIKDKFNRKAACLQLNTAHKNEFETFQIALNETLKNTFSTSSFDMLVNNAGIGINTPFEKTSEEQFDMLMNIHLKGVFFLTQLLLPVLNDGGRIINISSGLARFCKPGYATYAAMKGAIEVLTRYLAFELGARKITVNTVAPGAIATDFGGGVVRDNEQVNKAIASDIALGRVGEAEDIGSVVAFLCSEEAGWINGQRIEVSGGMLL